MAFNKIGTPVKFNIVQKTCSECKCDCSDNMKLANGKVVCRTCYDQL